MDRRGCSDRVIVQLGAIMGLTENNLKNLCISLANSDSEDEVIKHLKNVGFWDDPSQWRYYGDNENNFSTIGNQQSRPEAALVEKLINSVDAVIMAECLSKGIQPDGPDAPQCIANALEGFFQIPDGRLTNLSAKKRTELAKKINLVATGKKTNPCYTIIDLGEGQSAQSMPNTLLSLNKSNKLRIPFVQGKFNMGGTGVLQFCGKQNLQLIISKRNPNIPKNNSDPTADKWAFTLVRREDPKDGVRSSTYRYLAPQGNLLFFNAESLPLLPDNYPSAYDLPLSYGTFIKVYEYQMSGLKTNILFDLYNTISLLLPTVALPIRFFERRDYSGHSLETTLSGLTVRLEEDKKENLEEGFPTSASLSINGQKLTASIYAFKRKKDENYKKSEGILFTINGQTHGFIPKAFFSRSSVGMSYLSDSILVVLDCSEFDGRTREDLFMNSRDRLRSGELKSEIERNLEELIRTHEGLRQLKDKRRREELEDKIKDDKPLAEVIEKIMKKSPTLSKIFLDGVRLTSPINYHPIEGVKVFKGKQYPTFFNLVHEYCYSTPKRCPINVRCRIDFSTDAENEYFNRETYPGRLEVCFDEKECDDFTCYLWNGTAHLHIKPPNSTPIGSILKIRTKVSDCNNSHPFISEFHLLIDNEQDNKPHSGKPNTPKEGNKGTGDKKQTKLNLPNVTEVRKDKWNSHEFDETSALKIYGCSEDGYDFFINMDNKYLLTESRGQSHQSQILETRFKYGMVLIGLAFLNPQSSQEQSEDEDPLQKISEITRTISPFLLPMISGLGDIDSNEKSG